MLNKAMRMIVAAMCLHSTFVHAQELKSLEAAAFNLGDQSAVVYYVDNNGRYEVNAIVGPNIAVDGPIVRHLVKLAPGENCIVSIGGQGPRTSMSVIEISREGDKLYVDVWSEKKVFAQHDTK